MSGIRGDYSKLEKLIKKMEAIGGTPFRHVLLKNVSEEAIDLVKQEFANGVGPYGAAWKPPVLRTGDKSISPLLASGDLKNSFHVARVGTDNFVIETNVIYASVHQYGAVITAKNWRTVRIKVKLRKPLARKLAKLGFNKAAVRAALRSQFAGGNDFVFKEVQRFGLVFRGRHTTGGGSKRTYGDWITKLSVKIPQRQIMPESYLPPSWEKGFAEAIDETLTKFFS